MWRQQSIHRLRRKHRREWGVCYEDFSNGGANGAPGNERLMIPHGHETPRGREALLWLRGATAARVGERPSVTTARANGHRQGKQCLDC